MVAVLILGGVAVLWFMLERQQAAISSLVQSQTAKNPTSNSSVAMLVGSTPTGNLGTNTTDAQITQGFQIAVKNDPDPTGISQSLLSIGSNISSIFTGAHAAAMKKEASTLNNANPVFLKEVQSVMNGLGQGAISETQAIAYLNQARDDYYLSVQPIIKGHWAYQGTEFPEPTYADSYQSRTGPHGSSSKNPDSHAPDPCNAACVTAHYMVDRTVVGLTKIIKAGGGQMTIEAFPNNGAIQGTPSVTIQYQRPSTAAAAANSLQSSLSSLLAGL